MALIGQYGAWTFEIKGNYMRSFKNLQIVSECETEDKTASSQKYVSAKNGKPIQITLTITLSAYLGVDVRGDAIGLIDAAQRSYQGYFYIQSKKLFPFALMMTKAEMKNFEIAPNGKWISCDMGITLKQSSKDWISGTPASSSSSTSSSSSGSSGSSSKSSSSSSSSSKKTSTKTSTSLIKTAASAAAGAISGVVAAVSSVVKTVSTAQKVSAAKQTTTTKTTTSKATTSKVKLMAK